MGCCLKRITSTGHTGINGKTHVNLDPLWLRCTFLRKNVSTATKQPDFKHISSPEIASGRPIFMGLFLLQTTFTNDFTTKFLKAV